MRYLIVILFLLSTAKAYADVLDYQIYTFEGEEKRILSEGQRNYSYTDIQVNKQFPLSGRKNATKVLKVTEKFKIGGSIYQEKEITGVGLWIQVIPEWYEIWSDGGFSWEWFNKEQDNIFLKLQEEGRLKVTMNKNGGLEEIKSIEFLTDVTLRLNYSWIPFSTKDTHFMIVKKGSILRFGP